MMYSTGQVQTQLLWLCNVLFGEVISISRVGYSNTLLRLAKHCYSTAGRFGLILRSSDMPQKYLKHTVSSQTHTVIKNACCHHKHTQSSQTHTVITNTRSHQKHTQSSKTHTVITNTQSSKTHTVFTNTHSHHKHTQSSKTHAVITNTRSHHKHTQSSQTHTVITNTHSHHKHTLLQSFCASQGVLQEITNKHSLCQTLEHRSTYIKEVRIHTYAYTYTFVVCTVCVVDQRIRTYIRTYICTVDYCQYVPLQFLFSLLFLSCMCARR